MGFIDCRYVFTTVFTSLKTDLQEDWFPTSDEYERVMKSLTRIEDYINEHDVTFCDFAFEIDGTLVDQASYYIDSYSEIKTKIAQKGVPIMEALT